MFPLTQMPIKDIHLPQYHQNMEREQKRKWKGEGGGLQERLRVQHFNNLTIQLIHLL